MSARNVTTGLFVIVVAMTVTACAPTDSGCSGGFDAELTPDATGFATPIEAAEAWAATTVAPDTGWTVTTDAPDTGSVEGESVVADDWVLTVVEAGGGGWLVQAQRCA